MAFIAKHQETRKLLLLWRILADYSCMIITVAGRLQLLVSRFTKFTLHCVIINCYVDYKALRKINVLFFVISFTTCGFALNLLVPNFCTAR